MQLGKKFPAGCLLRMIGFILLAIIGSAWLIFSNDSPINKRSAVRTTVEWARLAELPDSKRDLRVEILGSPFTREFRISFRDEPATISAWIKASPGPASVSPVTDPKGWSVYQYSAGGGANCSEVRVSPSGQEVIVRTCWS